MNHDYVQMNASTNLNRKNQKFNHQLVSSHALLALQIKLLWLRFQWTLMPAAHQA